MHFSLVLIDKPNRERIRAFDDVILPIFFALRRLGYETEILRHQINPNSRNLIFSSANDPALTGLTPPQNSIVVNLEQLSVTDSTWNSSAYIEHLRQFKVWDYSHRNIQYLSAKGIKADLLTLGYVPEMSRLRPDFPVRHDVLFYGLASPRRQAVLDELRGRGANINQPSSAIFAGQRDLAIASSRLTLNIHHYLPAVLELGRLGYLWANRRPVVSELRPDTEVFPGLEEACAFCPYEDLVPTTLELLGDDRKLKKQGEIGFEAFSALSLETSLEKLVGRRTGSGLKTGFSAIARPTILNVGSGSDFRNDALNIDINSACKPDLTLDISKPLTPSAVYQTERFGAVSLEPSSFHKIIAFNVLQEVDDLPITMNNLLKLLEDGGELKLSVPYDLSAQAWSALDRRCFNLHSFNCYVDEAWKSGWRDERFVIAESLLILSDLGCKLVRRGGDREKLINTPRAVDSLLITMKKCKIDEKAKETYDLAYKEACGKPGINWEALEDNRDACFEARARAFEPANWRRLKLKLLALNGRYYWLKFLGLFNVGHAHKELMKKERASLRRLLK
ncbi:hypothetical protein LJB86_01790 [Deltaproteobacteria bacterium OttesenSCG-928-M10]|nr:hypothetical protein [Deltaproteobacteria bacterium OttesenSCG-928-M10]